eukprot:11427360-Heterocapsa_arctica.AAC.1
MVIARMPEDRSKTFDDRPTDRGLPILSLVCWQPGGTPVRGVATWTGRTSATTTTTTTTTTITT